MMVQKGPSTTMQKPQGSGQLLNYEKISQDPLKHVITSIEKKIRNLDKRKAKLDGYRRMAEDGKPLDPDQTAAASKYDEVIGSLEFAKDLIKSFEATAIEVMKQQRKTSRREQIAREEADNNRVCFVFRASQIMELLHGNDTIRKDFLNGSNGACVASKLELDQLVNFYELYIMKIHDPGTNVIECSTSAGNHMYELAEGRTKDIVGTTYKELHTLLDRISDSKYFDNVLDTRKPTEINASEKSVAESVSSEYSTEKETARNQRTDDAAEQDADVIESEALSPNSSDPVSSPSGFSADGPLKTEEFSASGGTAAYATHTDTTWQEQQLKSDGEDCLPHDVTFQYAPTDAHHMMQRAYEAQRIEEVLAEVQGPCQFLQESIIDREVKTTSSLMSFTGMDMHQQSHPLGAHLHSSTLESTFQSRQDISSIEQAIMTSQSLPNVQQHLGTNPNDSSPSLSGTVKHQDIDKPQEKLQAVKDSFDREDSYQSTACPTTYMSLPSTTNTQPKIEYTMGQSTRQQADNLGLGQTTFGGQQQATNPHISYMRSCESSPFQPEDARTDGFTAKVGYTSVAGDVSLPMPQSVGIQNLMQQHQLSSPSLHSTELPVPHIPLPNEQQSGYRGFHPNGTQQNETQDVSKPETTLQEQKDVSISGDQPSIDMASKDVSETTDMMNSKNQQQTISDSELAQQPDQSNCYNQRSSSQQQYPQAHSQSGKARGGYSNSGYRSAPVNQSSGNYHPQRYNYRPGGGGRYNGSYDSMGRPNNYSGGYREGQSGNAYRAHQDQYGYRRGVGGGMRGGRGGHARGNPRGGGNYGRSRTFRPQHSNEQAA